MTGQIHVTERESAHVWPDGQSDDSHWEDCLWCSLTEWLHHRGLISDAQATHTFAEKLRAASGEPPTGGSNLSNARDGVRAVLGLELPITILGAQAIWSALRPGTVAVLNGSMGVFASTGHWRRWDPAFGGTHSAFGARLDELDRIWWCDPLAPAGVGYTGEWMSKSDLLSYLAGFSGGQALVAVAANQPPAPAPRPIPAPVPANTTPRYAAMIKPTANIRLGASSRATWTRAVDNAGETWDAIGYVTGEPDTGSDQWLIWWSEPSERYEYTAKSNVVSLDPLVAPAPTPAPAPAPAPAPEPAPSPSPEPAPMPVPEPATPEPEPMPQPEPAPVPEPVPASELPPAWGPDPNDQAPIPAWLWPPIPQSKPVYPTPPIYAPNPDPTFRVPAVRERFVDKLLRAITAAIRR